MTASGRPGEPLPEHPDGSYEPLPDHPEAPDDVLPGAAVVVEEAEPPGGPFGSWGSLYLVMIVYAVVTIVGLRILTVAMNAP